MSFQPNDLCTPNQSARKTIMQDLPEPQNLIEPGDHNTIDQVTVFTDQAQVKRCASTSLKLGLNVVSVEVSAFKVYSDTVQAEVFASGNIIGVQYKEIPLKQFRQANFEQLESEKKQLQQDLRLLDQKRENELKRRKFVDSIVKFSDIQVPQEIQTSLVSVEKMRDIMGFISESYEDISQSIKALEIKIEEYNNSIKLIDQQFKEKVHSGKKNIKLVEVIFDSTEEQACKLNIFYNVSLATWQPVYKLEVLNHAKDISLQQFAKITQTTGEDWTDTQISISNAVAIQNMQLPQLNSWLIDIYRAPPMPVAASACDDLICGAEEGEVFEDLDLGSADSTLEELSDTGPAKYIQAEQREQGIAFEFDIPQRVNINSGAEEATLPIAQKSLPCEFFHYAVPKIDSHAYFVCSVQPDSNLLPGAVNVYHEGRYVATTRLQDKHAGEAMIFNLGIDRGVKVLKQKTKDRKTETFFGMVDRSSLAREVEHLTSIENLKDETVTLKYIDHIPVSKTDIIQIKGLELTPEPSEKNYLSKEGVLLWNTTIDAGQAKEVKMKFFIKHPKSEAPTGL